MRACTTLLVPLALLLLLHGASADTWAVLIAGSSGFFNYRQVLFRSKCPGFALFRHFHCCLSSGLHVGRLDRRNQRFLQLQAGSVPFKVTCFALFRHGDIALEVADTWAVLAVGISGSYNYR